VRYPARRKAPNTQPLENMNDDLPKDLLEAIEQEKTGTGPLTIVELVDLNELRICLKYRGRLGWLNSARLEHLKARQAIFGANT
jgi:hypothetical protein